MTHMTKTFVFHSVRRTATTEQDRMDIIRSAVNGDKNGTALNNTNEPHQSMLRVSSTLLVKLFYQAPPSV